MISTTDAREKIHQLNIHCPTESVSLYECLGRVNQKDIHSEMDVPNFDQSAMDGYAFRFADYVMGAKLFNEGDIPAGTTMVTHVDPKGCKQVFTGSMIPPEADTVIVQEKTETEGKLIILKDDSLKQGANIRKKGEQTRAGERVLEKGTMMNEAVCGFLAGLGIDKIEVNKKPSIDIITTGNELIRPPEILKDGKVYESNSFSLKNALAKMQLNDFRIRKAMDSEVDLKNKIEQGLRADILIVSGGVSVGAYDFVAQTFESLGVDTLFHGVKQKPGKPIYMGKKGNTLVFGLPGNPASVLTCFYMWVRPAICKWMGIKNPFPKAVKIPLNEYFKKKPGLSYFMQGIFTENGVEIIGNQQSFKMNGFAQADCLVYLPEETEHFPAGEPVSCFVI